MDACKSKKEAPRGVKQTHSFSGHRSDIARVAWSPDGALLASASYDRTVRIWDVRSGQVMATLSGHKDVVFGLAWSPDSRRLATASWDSTVRLWDVATGRHARTLKGHQGSVNCVAWSPDGSVIATASNDGTIRLWDAESDECLCCLAAGKGGIVSISWSASGKGLLSLTDDNRICIWDVESTRPLWTSYEEKREVKSARISPDETVLAVGTGEGVIEIWDLGPWDELLMGAAPSDPAADPTQPPVSGPPDKAAAGGQPSQAESASKAPADAPRPSGPKRMLTLKGHCGAVTSICFSHDGRMMASKSNDGTLRLWRSDTWDEAAFLEEPVGRFCPPGLDFHPRLPALASLGEQNLSVRIWKLDEEWLIPPHLSDTYYSNAKVLVLGDSGSGKTQLIRALCGIQEPADNSIPQAVRPDIAQITLMERQASSTPTGRQIVRETLLWEIPDTPDNRAVGTLQMTGAAAAMIVFDIQRETNRLAGVRRWHKLLQAACRAEGRDVSSLKIILVANKCDLGRPKISEKTIDKAGRELGLGAAFRCSALTGDKIPELCDALRKVIEWRDLPSASSPHVLQIMADYAREWSEDGRIINTRKKFLANFMERISAQEKQEAPQQRGPALGEKLRGKILALTDIIKGEITQRDESPAETRTPPYPLAPLDRDLPPIWVCRPREQAPGSSLLGATMLRGGARRVEDKPTETELAVEKLRSLWRENPAQLSTFFECCLELAEARGILRRLAYGDLILTRPVMLYDYARMISSAAAGEVNGLGFIEEKSARTGEFGIPENKKIANLDQERLMLVGTVEEMLLHGIAVREPSDAGPLLVMPCRFGVELPEKSCAPKSTLVIRFAGDVDGIYARLIARLACQKGWTLAETWRNEACFQDEKDAPFRIHLARGDDDTAELKINFDLKIDRAKRFEIERFIYRHLKHRSQVDRLEFYRPLNCAECGATFTPQQLEYRVERGYDWITCCVCETHVQIREEHIGKICEAGASEVKLRAVSEDTAERIAGNATG